jgi:hypothetical protein
LWNLGALAKLHTFPQEGLRKNGKSWGSAIRGEEVPSLPFRFAILFRMLV